jgi:hypothetical protein
VGAAGETARALGVEDGEQGGQRQRGRLLEQSGQGGGRSVERMDDLERFALLGAQLGERGRATA